MKRKIRTINRDFVAMVPKSKKAPIPTHLPDRFEARETAGTRVAEAIIAWQNPHAGGTMPTPPKRRSA